MRLLVLLACAVVLQQAVFPATSFAQQDKSFEEMQTDLEKIDRSIELTRKKMREMKDVRFLADIYFVLGELLVEKSRYQYAMQREKNKKTPLNEIDFSASRKTKQQAIEIYQRITEQFTKIGEIDRALFYMAHEYRELGQIEDMLKTYNRIVREFPTSPFWEESQLIIGDYFFEQKKDPKLAMEVFNQILARKPGPFTPLAHYRKGWCLVNLEKMQEALLNFESVLTKDSNISSENLPDVYKKSDVKRDALVAMVYPYSELKKYDPERANPLEYFEKLSPNKQALLKVLERLAKRLIIKDRYDQAIPVYLRLLEVTNDIERRVETTDRLYQALRKSKKAWPLDEVADEMANTLIRARFSSVFSAAEKRKNEINFEIYIRDVTTRLQKRANLSKDKKDYLAAAQAYKAYLSVIGDNKWYDAILLNQAESYFNAGSHTEAGRRYEKLYRRPSAKKRKELLDSAIQAYALALKKPVDQSSRLEVVEAREGFRDVGRAFVKLYPQDQANPMIYFNIGRTYYDERDFDGAVKAFMTFINVYPTHKEVPTAGNLVLDAYNQREDYDGLIKAGKSIINNRRITNMAFKSDVANIVKQAEYKKIQAKAGDFSSPGYAKKLMGFAKQYRGSDLGDQALYEAFVAYKAKKDPQAYEPGEMLLNKYGNSKYAKQVVGDMGQMAVLSADYRRAANYFETFAKRYPGEKETPGLLKNAASVRELLGDHREAAGDYEKLGASYYPMAAKQYYLASDWPGLSSFLRRHPVGGIKGSYYTGLALYRQGQIGQAMPSFQRAAHSPASNYDEKKMAAHSLYLLASVALKDYASIQLGGGNETKLIQTKASKLQALTNQLQRVIQYGNGRWTIAALYSLGLANKEFASFVKNASMPAGLNAAQQSQFRAALYRQAQQYEAKAKQYFGSCVQNAEKFEVFTGFVGGCRSGGETRVDEAQDERQVAKGGDSAPADAGQIRRKLFDQPRNVKLLGDLAQSYLRAGDYATARVIYSRALEIEPKNAALQANLGTSLMFMNDLEAAHQAFKDALKMRPSEPNALWSLAGLYNQFQFSGKARMARTRATSSGRPSGVVHPWVNNIR